MKIFRILLAFVALLAGSLFVAWAMLFQKQPYAFLIRQEEALLGSYYPMITGGVLWFVIALIPALAIFGRRAERHEQGSVGWCRSQIATSKVLMLAALVLLALGGAAYHFSTKVQGSDEEAEVIDLATFDDAGAWFKKVRYQGYLEEDLGYVISETGSRSNTETHTLYTPIREEEAEKGDLVRFIDQRSVRATNGEFSSTLPANLNKGYLRPGILPLLARDAWEEEGVVLADTTYFIVADGLSQEEMLWVVTGVTGVFGAVLLFAGALSLLTNKKRLKKALTAEGAA